MKVAVTMLVSCVAALLALGRVMLYSSSMAQVGAHYLVKQLVGCAIGMVLCVMAAALDYRRLKKFAWPLFALAVVLLVLVFLPHIGIRRNGAARWLGYGKTSLFQPSEFAKLALIIALAWYCEWFQRQMSTLKRGMVIPGLFIGLVLVLVFKEPDVGNMLLMATVSGVLLLIGGIRLRYFLPPVIAGALAVGVFIYHNPMRSERVASLARFVMHLPANTEETAAQQWFERTLDDSANRRIVLPEAFLATDALLILAANVAGGLEVREAVIGVDVARSRQRVRRRVAHDLFAPHYQDEGLVRDLGHVGGDQVAAVDRKSGV
jgi:hypothetical protein